MCSRPMFIPWIILLSLVSFITWCAFVRGQVEEPFPEDRIADLHKGISARQDVAQRFGAPDEIVQANGHEIFHCRRFDRTFGWLIFMPCLNVASDNLWVF